MKIQKLTAAIALAAASSSVFAAATDITAVLNAALGTSTAVRYVNLATSDANIAINAPAVNTPSVLAGVNSAVNITQTAITGTPQTNQTPIGLSIGGTYNPAATGPIFALSEISTNGIGTVSQGDIEAQFKTASNVITGANGGNATLKIDNSTKGNVAAVGGISSTSGDVTKTVDLTTTNGSLSYDPTNNVATVSAGTQTSTAGSIASTLASTSLGNVAYNLTSVNSSVTASGVGSVAVNNVKVNTNAIGAVQSGNIKVTGI